MMKYEWVLKSGKIAVLRAEYSETVRDEIVYADGYEINTGKKKIVQNGDLAVYVDGKKVGSCWDVNFWRVIDMPGMKGYKRIWGIDRVGFTEEVGKEIESFLKAVVEAGVNPKAQEIREAEAKKKAEYEIARAEEIVKKAEGQTDIPSRKEAERRMKEYNDMVNDGGEGFVPYIVSREEYEDAKETLRKYGK